jgi:hypothetical protein
MPGPSKGPMDGSTRPRNGRAASRAGDHGRTNKSAGTPSSPTRSAATAWRSAVGRSASSARTVQGRSSARAPAKPTVCGGPRHAWRRAGARRRNGNVGARPACQIRRCQPCARPPIRTTAARRREMPRIAGQERRVYALVAGLPYSGAQTAFFSVEMTIDAFLEGHVRVFEWLGRLVGPLKPRRGRRLRWGARSDAPTGLPRYDW